MMRIAHFFSRGLFGAGVLGALAFGAAQFTAVPASAAPPTCFPAECDRNCKSAGYDSGICFTNYGCICAV